MKKIISLSLSLCLLISFFGCEKDNEPTPTDTSLSLTLANARTIDSTILNSYNLDTMFIETAENLAPFFLLGDSEANYCSCDINAMNSLDHWFSAYPNFFMPHFSIHPDDLNWGNTLDASLCHLESLDEKVSAVIELLDSLSTYSIFSKSEADKFKLFLLDLSENPESVSYSYHMSQFASNDDSKLFIGLIAMSASVIPALNDSDLPNNDTVLPLIHKGVSALGSALGSVLWEVGTTVYDHGESALHDPDMGRRYWRAALGGFITGGILSI